MSNLFMVNINVSNELYTEKRRRISSELIYETRFYRVAPIIRPSVIFEDDFNVSPTLKISPGRLVKILRDIGLSETSAGILETDDLQDIPEDDDTIVFE